MCYNGTCMSPIYLEMVIMVLDVTGIELTPGNNCEDCLGNGRCFDKDGIPIECCCDECNYMWCCFVMNGLDNCSSCNDILCPRKKDKIEQPISVYRIKI